MSPTVLRVRGYRFFFFSREEPRLHVHVHHADGEGKWWIEPAVELAQNQGLDSSHMDAIRGIILEYEDEIRAAWRRHFER